MEPWERIEQAATDLSKEFGSGEAELTGAGDTAMLRRELLSLWSLSGLTIDQFVAVLDTAAQTTKAKSGRLGTFMAELRDILGDQDMRLHKPVSAKAQSRR